MALMLAKVELGLTLNYISFILKFLTVIVKFYR